MEQQRIFLSRAKTTVCHALPYGGLLFFAILLLLQSPSNPTSAITTYMDSSVFLYGAKTILQGGVPYVDFFDHKGPLIYLINAVALLIDEDSGIWIMEILFLFGTLTLFYHTCKLFAGNTASFFATILSASLLADVLKGGNFTEEFAMFFHALALFLFAQYFLKKQLSTSQIIILGATCACAFMLKPSMIAFWAGFSLCVIVFAVKQRNFGFIGRYVICFLIGCVLILLPIMIWLGMNGALSDWYDQAIAFNALYGNLASNRSRLSTAISFAGNIVFAATLFITIIALLWQKYSTDTFTKVLPLQSQGLRFLLIANALALLLTFLHAIYPGRIYYHYVMMYLPCFVVPFALLSRIIQQLFLEKKFSEWVLASVLVFALTWQIIIPNATLALQKCKDIAIFTASDWRHRLRTDNPVVKFIDENSAADDKIVVFGNACWIYLDSNRMSATRYEYQPFNDAIRPDLYEDFAQLLRAAQPKLLVIPLEENDLPYYREDFPIPEGYSIAYEDNQYEIYLREA